ncbi:hypothetical protein NHH03_04015 [Stieleria sp. TO1_6]|uniref:hypothetical protein n=1 Tax=Stieleria tagensis TaxID=2956795 RepID=UPI00209B19A7|nr:hypothetical protein [Stieleria tagensis]MCO8120891.1 hypothetical protein [Stieleria tagensis]
MTPFKLRQPWGKRFGQLPQCRGDRYGYGGPRTDPDFVCMIAEAEAEAEADAD